MKHFHDEIYNQFQIKAIDVADFLGCEVQKSEDVVPYRATLVKPDHSGFLLILRNSRILISCLWPRAKNTKLYRPENEEKLWTITVSADRTAREIAKDIARRLAGYPAEYEKQENLARKSDEEDAFALSVRDEFIALTGGSAPSFQDNSAVRFTNGYLRVDSKGETVELLLNSLTVEKAKAVIRLVQS